MKKKALKVFIFFAAVAILTTAASYFFISGYIYPLIITSTKRVINEYTGADTEIGQVRLSFFPPGIEMTEIALSIEDREKASLRIKRIRAELDPVQALSGTINVNRISVMEPEIDAYLTALPQRKPEKDTLKDKLQPKFFKVNIREIDIEKGHFIVRRKDDEYLEIKEAFLTFYRTGADSLSFAMRAEKGKLAFKGQEEGLDNIKVEGRGDEKAITISDLSFSTAYGTLFASADIGLKPSIDVKGRIKGQISLDRLSAYTGKDMPFRKEGALVAAFFYKDKKAGLEASIDYREKVKPLEFKTSISFLDKEMKIREGKIDANNLKADMTGSIFPDNKIDLQTKLTVNDLSSLLAPYMSPAPSGRLTTEAEIKGTLSKPRISAHIKADNLAYLKYRADALTGVLNYSDNRLSTEAIRITYGKAAIITGGSLLLAGRKPLESNLKVEIPPCRIPDLLAMTGKTLPIEGNLRSEVYVSGSIDKLRARGQITIEEGEFYGERAEFAQLNGEYFNETFRIEELLLRHGQSTVTARGTIPKKGKIDIDLHVKSIDLATISHIDNKASGMVDLKGKIAGNLAAPVLKGDLSASKVRSEKADLYANLEGKLYAKINTIAPYKHLITYSSDKLHLFLKDEKEISLTPFTMKFEDKTLSFSRTGFTDRYGSVSLMGKLTLEGDADISIKAASDLKGLETLLNGVEDIGGQVEVAAEIKGKIQKPILRGAIYARKGMVRFKGFPYNMTDIEGELNLINNKVTLDNVRGTLENSKFTGGGYLVFDGFKPSETRLFFDIEEVELSFPRWLPSRSKGRITITAMGREVTLGGDIEILRASYTDEVEYKSFLAKIIKLTDTKKFDGEIRKEAEEGNLNINIRFRADDNLIIKNNLADIELKGDLILLGKGRNLSLIGSLETIGGKGYFREREFIIRKGTIDFNNRERIVPIVNIDAETTIKNYLIDVNISGPPKNLVVILNSDPPLEEKEIVSLVTFGYTADELRGRDTQLTSVGAASLILQEDIEAKIKQYFGFDRFRVESYYSETAETTETRITVDKDLGKDTTATYSRGLSTLDEEVKVEYRLDDNLSLEGSWESTEETVGAFGGDVILRYEFE